MPPPISVAPPKSSASGENTSSSSSDSEVQPSSDIQALSPAEIKALKKKEKNAERKKKRRSNRLRAAEAATPARVDTEALASIPQGVAQPAKIIVEVVKEEEKS